ncbi:hypothetical protein K488DRAFT_38122, partial [Vararia minispora EC-137]
SSSSSSSSSSSGSGSGSSSSSSSSSGSSNGCNGKVGLAWSNHEADIIYKFKTNSVCWIYDWEESLQYGMKTDGMEFIVMLWGQKNAAAFGQKAVAGYANWAAGMNEPDISSQSNLSPSEGAALWNQYFCGLKSQGYSLISPATATGPSWLQQFKAQGVCDWDVTAAHVYTTTVSNFQTAVTAYHTAFNKPVMVTEYSCNDYSGANQQCDNNAIWAFMTGTKAWMDSQSWIKAYFFFAPMTASELQANNINGANAMITSDGSSLTDLAKYYI